MNLTETYDYKMTSILSNALANTILCQYVINNIAVEKLRGVKTSKVDHASGKIKSFVWISTWT